MLAHTGGRQTLCEVARVVGELVGRREHQGERGQAGQFGMDPYSKRIARMAKERAEWIRTPGFFGPKQP